MKRTLLAVAASASVVMSGAANALNIDLFSDPALPNGQQISVDAATPNAFSEYAGSDILGGSRDLVLEFVSSPLGNGASMGAGGGLLSVNAGSSTVVTAKIQWDGPDGAATFDKDGLAPGGAGTGVDVTTGCGAVPCDRFFTTVLNADQGFPYQITAVDGSGNESTLLAGTQDDVLFPATQTADYLFEWFQRPQNLDPNNPYLAGGLFFLIDRTGADVDFSDIAALQLVFNPSVGLVPQDANLDLTIGAIDTRLPVPGSIALLGFGGLLAGFAARRRKS